MRIGITERGDAGQDMSWLRTAKDKNVAGIIAITKFPSRLTKVELPDNVIVHCTITGLGGSPWEPNVPPIGLSLWAYEQLVAKYGNQRVVLRIDPIIMGHEEPAFEVVARAKEGRVRISFLDLYPHVIARMKTMGLDTEQTTFHAPLNYRLEIYKALCELAGTEVEVCAEPGMKCTGCISARDIEAMGLVVPANFGKCGQRKECHCIADKVELLSTRGQCAAKCVYCYWR